MNPFIQLKQTTSVLVVALLLSCFASSAETRAVEPAAAPDTALANGNTADGDLALAGLTTGLYNSAFGVFSLLSNGAGNLNTGVGAGALFSNTAAENTATGAGALFSNTTGTGNVANGAFTLIFNTTGSGNVAVGDRAMENNTGNGTTAVGAQALLSNTTGSGNTAIGSSALQSNTTGEANTAIGASALLTNTTGGNNTAIGDLAGSSVTTGSGNVFIGAGATGVGGESDHTYIANINTTTVSGGGTDTVTVDLSTGLLGHLSSSRRYKEEIKPMDKASEALFALKPVSYRFKKEIDQSQSIDYGLIAEEVAEVDPNLAIRNGKGQIEGVRYNAINAMLLNEFIKEHKKVQQLEANDADQQREIKALVATVKEQAAQIQKVSAQLEASRSAPQVANSNY
jgi:hypothetical protein